MVRATEKNPAGKGDSECVVRFKFSRLVGKGLTEGGDVEIKP